MEDLVRKHVAIGDAVVKIFPSGEAVVGTLLLDLLTRSSWGHGCIGEAECSYDSTAHESIFPLDRHLMPAIQGLPPFRQRSSVGRAADS
jgi:hypothetical protein